MTFIPRLLGVLSSLVARKQIGRGYDAQAMKRNNIDACSCNKQVIQHTQHPNLRVRFAHHTAPEEHDEEALDSARGADDPGHPDEEDDAEYVLQSVQLSRLATFHKYFRSTNYQAFNLIFG